MTHTRSALTALTLLLVAAPLLVLAQQRGTPSPEERARQAAAQAAFEAEIVMENPIEPLNSIWIEELTWIEVRDAMASGKTTAIVSTGGVEQNGPYVALGKHNYVLQGACERIARALGDALCAPIIKLVPEGSIDPPSSHMRYPGTLTVREETFRMMLEDVASSLNAHGFEHVILIGDSGGNQRGMAAVAEAVNARWGKPVAHYIPEFYNNGDDQELLRRLGITEESEGFHDFYWSTALQMTVSPESVRYDQRVAAGKGSINGVSIAPKEDTIAIGKQLMQNRADRTVKAIHAAIGR